MQLLFKNFLIDHDLRHEKEFDELLESLELVINHYQKVDKKAKYIPKIFQFARRQM
jgi:hypothetical protein